MVNMPDKFLQEADGNPERGTQFYGWTQGKDRAIEEEKEKTVRGPYERRKKGCQERRVKIIIKALYLENVVSLSGNHIAPAFTLVLPPPDLLKAPPGLVTAGWAETNQKKNDLLQYA